MKNEWKPNEPAVEPGCRTSPLPNIIASDGENPPLEVLLEGALAIKARLDMPNRRARSRGMIGQNLPAAPVEQSRNARRARCSYTAQYRGGAAVLSGRGNPATRPDGRRALATALRKRSSQPSPITSPNMVRRRWEPGSRRTIRATYLRIMSSFVPREPKQDDFGDLSDEEIVEAIERAERHRIVERMIDAIE